MTPTGFGLDVASVVRGVLSHDSGRGRSHLSGRLTSMLAPAEEAMRKSRGGANPYARLFATRSGSHAAEIFGNESRTLDSVSWLSVEVLFEYMAHEWSPTSNASAIGRRFLSVPGLPDDRPALVILDPTLSDISQSRRLTNEIDFNLEGLMSAFDRLRPALAESEPQIAKSFSTLSPTESVELLWISQPEVVLTRRPRMVPLCVPFPSLEIGCPPERSTAGILCRDADGVLGVTACYHGTGPVGTSVTIGGLPSSVKRENAIQDIVFIPLPAGVVWNTHRGRAGIRTDRAPAQADLVSFEGVGSGGLVTTRIQSHDAGILRRRPSVQLKVQTPADANNGDSGAALVDADDHVLGFGFERSAIGEFPELTDWIWADNALRALGLTPLP